MKYKLIEYLKNITLHGRTTALDLYLVEDENGDRFIFESCWNSDFQVQIDQGKVQLQPYPSDEPLKSMIYNFKEIKQILKVA